GPRMRDVSQERAERDDELDAEIARELDDQVGEGAPAEVRLDPEQQHRVLLDALDPGMVEGRLRPVDPPGQALLERDVRAGDLKVEEVLRVDLGELPRLPVLGEIAAGERCALPAVVPAAEGGD